MIIDNEYWKLYKNFKQEVLNLKQIKKANVASRYFSYTHSGGTYYNSFEITYKNGSQPIISEVLSYSDTALSAPIGNKQYIFAFSQAIPDITILSTREIDSIVGIS